MVDYQRMVLVRNEAVNGIFTVHSSGDMAVGMFGFCSPEVLYDSNGNSDIWLVVWNIFYFPIYWE